MKRKLTHLMLTNGVIVEAVKDCNCLPKLHNGPHWVHDDELWQERNKQILEPGVTFYTWLGFCKEESLRLQDKLSTMRSMHIERLIYNNEVQS